MSKIIPPGGAERFPPDGPEDKIRPTYSGVYLSNNHKQTGGPTPDVTKAGVTLEEGMKLVRSFNKTGNAGALLMLRDTGLYDYVERTSQPCTGWARPYGKGSLRNGYWPGDLIASRNLFPDGVPVAIIFAHATQVNAVNTPIVEEGFLSPQYSPWRSVLKDFEIVKNNNQYYTLIKDLDIEPTVMLSLFRGLRFAGAYAARYNTLRKDYPNIDPKVIFLAAMCTSGTGPITFMTHENAIGGGAPDWQRMLISDPVDHTGGTFSKRYAYNRPEIDYVFGENVEPKLTSPYKTFTDVFNAIETWKK